MAAMSSLAAFYEALLKYSTEVFRFVDTGRVSLAFDVTLHRKAKNIAILDA